MKKLYLLLILSFFALQIIAQQWTEKLPERGSVAYTFFDYQKAFNDYWEPFDVKKGYYYENGEKQKAPGWKQFKRWEYFWESRVNQKTGAFPEVDLTKVYEEYVLDKQNGRSSSGNWASLGPNSSGGGYAGIGRINCVQFHPTNANIFWIGAPAGGIWVTENGGSSWTILNNNTEVIGVSDIIIPSDYDATGTIYIATGDRDAWDNRSVGVLKSTDEGATWEATGLSFTVSQGENTYRMLLDPNDDETILAATTDGLYKTTNGGTNWTKLTTYEFIDMEYKPGNFSTLYGSTTNGKIYLSTNSGSSWTQVHSGGSRIELAVSADEPTWVYALISNSSSALYGVYKSTNSGASFSQVYDGAPSGHNLLGWNSNGTGTSGQGWYDLSLAADPFDANKVYLGGVNTWRTTNGGTSWNIVNHWWGDGVQAVHADKHNLKFNESTGVLFEVNDGGVYKTSNGTSWTHLTNGLVISQIYKLSVSQTEAETTIIGLQDNGTKALLSGVWDDVIGGDGMECLIDYTDENVQYGSLYYGDIYRTTNGWGSDYNISDNIPGGANGAWVTPYIIDPVNNQTLYVGYEDLWKTTNRGNSFTKIGDFSDGTLKSLAICYSDPNVIVTATNTKMQKTTNGGASWTTITSGLPSSTITYVTIKANDPSVIWVTLSSYSGNSVYKTTNGGGTWTNISGTLPSIPAGSIVQNRLNTIEEELYVGTDAGVYLKLGNADWVPFSTGLPNVVVGELEIYYDAADDADSKLRAATYGRGLWETDLYSDVEVLLATIVATPGCDTGTITVSSNVSGEQTYYLTDPAGAELDSATVNAEYYDFEGVQDGFYKGKIKKDGNYSILTEVVELANDTVPAQTGDISGEATVCIGSEGLVYLVEEVENTTNYVWTLPAGINIVNGDGTNSIVVDFTEDAVSGTITVQAENDCGAGESSNDFQVAVITIPGQAGDISGEMLVCLGDEGLTYQVDEVEYAEVYNWTLPAGFEITSGEGSNSIQVSISTEAEAGTITVQAENDCGTGAVSNDFQVEVTTAPEAAGDISGPTLITGIDEAVDYMVEEIEGAESYSWVLDPSWTLVSGQGTNQIQIIFDSDAADGILTVSAENICGFGEESMIEIDVVHVGLIEFGPANIKIYPNPTNGNLKIEFGKEINTEISISVVNLLGENVLQLENLSQKQIQLDLSGFVPGIYLVRIQAG
ncbi:MAG TPA: T9SS type A sorting domain-containing protein, partial [Bacteroidales bacterium]